jgi:nitrogen fixation/metabolism regulation signal transduction histidine kinase
MRVLVVVIGLAFGCAHPRSVARAPVSVDEEAPAPAPPAPVFEEGRSIRLVARRPPHYKFVGRVRASVLNDDFVLAAKQAHQKLTRRAEALGADVVKLERIDPAATGRVVLAGRAYRLAD